MVLRTLTLIVSAHPYCAGKFTCHVHSRSQRPCSFWSAPRIATSGKVQLRKSAIHGLRILRVKSDKSVWLLSRSIVLTNPFKTEMSLDLARGSTVVKQLGMRGILALPVTLQVTFPRWSAQSNSSTSTRYGTNCASVCE